MGRIMAVNISEKKGTQKKNVHSAKIIRGLGYWKTTPTQANGTVR